MNFNAINWYEYVFFALGLVASLYLLRELFVAIGRVLLMRSRLIKPWQDIAGWQEINKLAARYARQLRCKPPTLYLLESFEPNGFVLAPAAGRPAAIVFTRRLLQLLSYEELEAFLLLAMVRSNARDFKNQPLVYLFASPLFGLRRVLPKVFALFLDPLIAAFVRVFLHPRRIFASDLAAAKLLPRKQSLPNALRRIGSHVQKEKIDTDNLLLEPFYLVPMHRPEAPFHFSYSQPDLDERIERLLH